MFICTFVRNWQTQFDRDSDIVRIETKIATGDNTNTDDVHSHTDNAEGSLIIGEMILAAKPWTELEWIWHPLVWESTSNCTLSEKILFTYSQTGCMYLFVELWLVSTQAQQPTRVEDEQT